MSSYKKSSPLKKVKLLAAGNEVQSIKAPLSPIIQPPVPLRRIKPPPTIFADLWDDAPEQTVAIEVSPTFTETIAEKPSDCETIERIEVEEAYRHRNTLDIIAREHELVLDEEDQEPQSLLTEDIYITALYEHEEEYTTKTLLDFEHTPTLKDFEDEFEQSSYLLDDLELLDIDSALAEQEEAFLRIQAEKSKIASRPGKGQAPGWQGAVSLIYVNWEHEEGAIQEALNRLGYAELAISETTRAFILQAAHAAGLPYQQERQLTTRLATARAQLAQIPPCDDPENDSYATKRNMLNTDITELEQTLVYKMQWVAIKKAPQFLGNNIELDDLIQYGILGVIAGIKHFDSSRQSKLLPVVNMWVFQSLRRAINDYGRLIRIPSYVCEQLDTIRKQHVQLQMTLGRLPSRKELADAMQLSVGRLEILLDDNKEHLSLDKSRRAEYANDGYSFQTIDDHAVVSKETSQDKEDEVVRKQITENLLTCLSAKERLIVCLRFGLDENRDPYTLEEVGKVLHVTRERIRQIESRALKKMKQSPFALQMMNWETEKGTLDASKVDSQQANERNKKTKRAEKSRGNPHKVDTNKCGV
jgi:RNA polymerase sigma factor (sigma-70 family)